MSATSNPEPAKVSQLPAVPQMGVVGRTFGSIPRKKQSPDLITIRSETAALSSSTSAGTSSKAGELSSFSSLPSAHSTKPSRSAEEMVVEASDEESEVADEPQPPSSQTPETFQEKRAELAARWKEQHAKIAAISAATRLATKSGTPVSKTAERKSPPVGATITSSSTSSSSSSSSFSSSSSKGRDDFPMSQKQEMSMASQAEESEEGLSAPPELPSHYFGDFDSDLLIPGSLCGYQDEPYFHHRNCHCHTTLADQIVL